MTLKKGEQGLRLLIFILPHFETTRFEKCKYIQCTFATTAYYFKPRLIAQAYSIGWPIIGLLTIRPMTHYNSLWVTYNLHNKILISFHLPNVTNYRQWYFEQLLYSATEEAVSKNMSYSPDHHIHKSIAIRFIAHALQVVCSNFQIMTVCLFRPPTTAYRTDQKNASARSARFPKTTIL